MSAEHLYLALMMLQIADAYTTLQIIGKGGRERNKYIRALMQDVGALPALVMVKTLMLIVILVLLPYLPAWFMALLIVGYTAVVINNVIVLRKLKSP